MRPQQHPPPARSPRPPPSPSPSRCPPAQGRSPRRSVHALGAPTRPPETNPRDLYCPRGVHPVPVAGLLPSGVPRPQCSKRPARSRPALSCGPRRGPPRSLWHSPALAAPPTFGASTPLAATAPPHLTPAPLGWTCASERRPGRRARQHPRLGPARVSKITGRSKEDPAATLGAPSRRSWGRGSKGDVGLQPFLPASHLGGPPPFSTRTARPGTASTVKGPGTPDTTRTRGSGREPPFFGTPPPSIAPRWESLRDRRGAGPATFQSHPVLLRVVLTGPPLRPSALLGGRGACARDDMRDGLEPAEVTGRGA